MTFNWFEIADKLKSHPELVGAEDQKKINFSMSIYTSLGGGSSITCVGTGLRLFLQLLQVKHFIFQKLHHFN